PEIIPVPVANTLEGLQQVAFGEVDAMMDYQFNITEKINDSGIRNLHVASVIEAPYGHAFGVRRDWPELLSILTKALQQITPDERRILARKWLQPYEEKTFSKQTVWLMLFAAEVLFTVFAFVLYWNFSLKRQVARRTVQLKQELVKYDRAEKELRESRAMLEQSNVELEHRVNERTRDLQAINAELQLAKEAADAATIAKSQFLANISHEVRTPLHGIMAFAELALLKEKTPPHRYLRAIMQSSRALLEIINDLLDVSKIEAGHLELEQAPFMLDDVVHHVCTVALHNAQAGGIELVVDMDPAMRLALVGDAGRLQQIIMNLVTNAVKFTGPGGQICVSLRQAAVSLDSVPHSVRVQDGEQQVRLICFVHDTGVGIAPEFMGQLFQPFRQVDASTTRRHGGTGLGLCICRQLVEMMHGEISVESEPGVGSSFVFSVPLVVQPGTELPPCTLTTRTQEPPCVLILSLSPLQTEVLCRHFAALGIRTITATSTSEALQKTSTAPDLLFFDRKLAEPGTLYALRLLRSAFGQTIPAILMDEHAGEQILTDSAENDGQVAILPVVTLRGLHEAVESLGEPCHVAYSTRLHALPRPMATPLFHDVRILVAEDNPTNQEIMEALFEDTGVQLSIVSNGKQALDALRVGIERGEHFD
ncbi:MAG: ATP-binding protein, partial [Bilophila sp.]